MLPAQKSTPAFALRRLCLASLCGLSLLGCSSNADALYQGELLRQQKLRTAGLPESRRVVVRDPASREALEVVELARGADGAEVRHGAELRYWPEGTLRSLRSFDRGTPAGLWWSWWRTGALRSAYVHDATKPTPMTWWHPNGLVSAEGMAISGRRVGEWSYYHDNGMLESRGKMGGGMRVGDWTFYDETGEWTERGRFLSGRRTGDWEFRSRAGGGPLLQRR